MTDATFEGRGGGGSVLQAPLPWVILAIWFAAAIGVAGSGALVADEGLPFGLMGMLAAPVGVAVLAYRFSRGVRAWVAALDMGLVVGVQVWRMIGIVFLFVWAMGDLPTVFALTAGLGDMAVGVFALIVLVAMLRGEAGWQGRVRAMTYAGMLDFAAAFGTAMLTQKGAPLQFASEPLPVLMQQLPLAMIPGFLVPLFLIFHLIALVRLKDA